MLNLFAAGKCSDLMIVCAKANVFIEDVFLMYYTRDHKHQRVATQVMNEIDFLKGHAKSIISLEPKHTAKEEAKKIDGIYLTTSIRDSWTSPNFEFKISQIISDSYIPKKEYICVQMEAGFGKRIVSTNVLKFLSEKFSQKIIVLGSNHIQTDDNIVEEADNRSGRTFSIVEAMNLIDHSVGFVGQEGLLSYYAAIRKKPCMINFAKDKNIKKKLFRTHLDNVIDLHHGESLNSVTKNQLKRFVALVENYDKE